MPIDLEKYKPAYEKWVAESLSDLENSIDIHRKESGLSVKHSMFLAGGLWSTDV